MGDVKTGVGKVGGVGGIGGVMGHIGGGGGGGKTVTDGVGVGNQGLTCETLW